MPLHPSTRSWEISREQVDIIKNIGKGAFSQVAEATAKNIYGKQGVITVAVKMLKGNGSTGSNLHTSVVRIRLRSIHTTPEKFENATFFLRLGLLFV